MSKKLGTLNYTSEEGYMKSFSEKTGKIIDEEVKKVIDECYNKCKEILNERRDLVEK